MKNMRIRIVSYEDINAWILGKFARRLHDELLKLGVNADISNVVDHTADINHHIIYTGYDIAKASAMDTLMITHVDDTKKLDLLSAQMLVAKAGICMSRSVMNELVSAGLPENKILFINPAHDGLIKTKKIVIGITSKVQPDGCKREYLVEELFNHISPEIFSLSIMGAGWNRIVERIRAKGFIVDYIDEFDYDKYIYFVPTFDYYLYTGQDEGSMGFIDALAAGIQTVVTPQGYHLDASDGITYAFNEGDELITIFKKIEQKKIALQEAVADWTWRDYAIKHLEVWRYLLHAPIENEGIQSRYTDGLNSLLMPKEILAADKIKEMKKKMRIETIKKTIYRARKTGGFQFLKKKIIGLINIRKK